MDANESSRQALRLCFLANAGAIVTLLAFLPDVPDSVQQPDFPTVKQAITLFAGGLLVSIIGTLWSHARRHVPLVFVFFALALFAWGAYISMSTLVEGAASWHPEGWQPEGYQPEGWNP